MLLSKISKFFKTIRFKLTLMYSLFFFLFSGLLILSLNVYLSSYLLKDPDLQKWPKPITIQAPNNPVIIIKNFQELQEEERERIKEIRLQDLNEIRSASLLALLPLALISFILGYWTSGSFLDPIGKLANQFETLSKKDLGKTIPVEVEDEVGELITSFNKLSTRLKNSFDAQEQFVQDASHELKTPLTVIQTSLDTLIDDELATKADLLEGMKNALNGMQNLKKLSENLLELSETENLKLETGSVNEVLTNQVKLLAQFAINQNVELLYEGPQKEIVTEINPVALGRAIYNLIENAIKYSTNTNLAKVNVSLTQDRKSITIRVNDNGPGIPGQYQSQIFKRFFRIDKSRNKKTGGFGLGLAIAKKIIVAHHGEITLSSSPGNTTFSIKLSQPRQ